MTLSASLRNDPIAAPSEAAPALVDRGPAVELRPQEGEREWLLTNARGTFALGAVDRVLRRKYHSLLTAGSGARAQNLLAEVIERVTANESEYALLAVGRDSETASKRPELKGFSCGDSAVWLYELGSVRLRRELVLAPDSDCIVLRYELSGAEAVELSLEPLLLFRSVHSIAQKCLFLDGRVQTDADLEGAAPGCVLSMTPYRRSPRLRLSLAGSRARFDVKGSFRELVHDWEGNRGYERGEFAFSPGTFKARLTPGEPVVLCLGTELSRPGLSLVSAEDPPSGVRGGSFRAILERSLQSFLVNSEHGRVFLAGFPWLGESIRQTLLALPAWLPHANAFLDVLEAVGRALAPRSSTGSVVDESVDAPLLFIRAVELSVRAGHGPRANALTDIAKSILRGWINGSHPRVRLSSDGLLFVSPGPWALTWMNATVDGLPVTARSGFAVDVNALFVNALAFLSRPGHEAQAEPWASLHERASGAFRRLFWSDTYGHLADCHDGTIADFSLRPNQLWAAALPTSPLSRAERLAVVNAVRDHLLTDVGIRTLSPRDPRYASRCEGDTTSRDRAAHQGSAWPFLLGLYADALSELGERQRLKSDLLPILARLARHVRSEGCVGQISELFDGDPPHEPRGAPAHAAGTAEVLRVLLMLERC